MRNGPLVVARADGRHPRGQVAYYLVRPSRTVLYISVRVFETLAQMRRYARQTRGSGLSDNFKGLATAFTKVRFGKQGAARVLPHAGEILLARRWAGSEVVSHECTHLALALAGRLHLNPMEDAYPPKAGEHTVKPYDGDEERFCYLLGQLVRGVENGLYARRILP